MSDTSTPDSKGPTPFSVVIPAKNESATIGTLVGDLVELGADEIIVVDDGSTDETASIARHCGATVISHPYSKGNGAAVKTGARAARHPVIVFMDADGQHRATDIPRMLATIESGFDLCVGARTAIREHSSIWRWGANAAYNVLASRMVGHLIEDLTSGFRAVNARKFKSILNLLPNGFSYPTTSTMVFFRAGHNVCFVPIQVQSRADKSSSHIRPLRDGARFLTIIFKVATLYSPLKLFAPTSLALLLAASAYYGFTFITDGRFTNMGVLLFLASLFALLIGLLSEQVTSLMYLNSSSSQGNASAPDYVRNESDGQRSPPE